MMKHAIIVGALLAFVPACSNKPVQATIGAFAFEIPSGWDHRDETVRGRVSAVWQPVDNPNKESITVLVTERSPIVAETQDGTIERLLAQAQTGLRGHASTPAPVRNAFGMEGARVEVDYVPPGLTTVYHRVHVVLASDKLLIHFLYTAKDPDALDAFNQVVSSFHREEG
jgi:hypothetical protein